MNRLLQRIINWLRSRAAPAPAPAPAAPAPGHVPAPGPVSGPAPSPAPAPAPTPAQPPANTQRIEVYGLGGQVFLQPDGSAWIPDLEAILEGQRQRPIGTGTPLPRGGIYWDALAHHAPPEARERIRQATNIAWPQGIVSSPWPDGVQAWVVVTLENGQGAAAPNRYRTVGDLVASARRHFGLG